MIDLPHVNLLALPRKIGRPWHGLLRNAADGQSASLTLDNGTIRPWPAPLEGNDAWLLQRPVATARLLLDVHNGAPGVFPPLNAPDWPLTSAAESARGLRYLDYAIAPHGTGAGGFPIVFAADGTPWVIGANPVTYADGGQTAIWSLTGWPYGRIGQAPAAGVALEPSVAGADRLALAPYVPDSGVVFDVPAAISLPMKALSISSDGKRWLMKVSASDHVAQEPPISCVLGIYEVVFSGGNATTPPTFKLAHALGWFDAMGVETDGNYVGRVIHAWYTPQDQVELVAMDREFTDGGYFGGATWRLWAGNRLIAQAVIRFESTASTLNGEPIPGGVFAGGGGLSGIPGEQFNLGDIRLRHHYVSALIDGTPDHRFILTPRLQSNSVIGLYAATAPMGSANIDWSRWIGAGSPSGYDASTIPDGGSVAIIPAPQICSACLPYANYSPDHLHGSWHPKTHQILRNQLHRIAFV